MLVCLTRIPQKRAVNVQGRKQGQVDKMSTSTLANPGRTGNKAVDCVFHHVPAVTVTWHEEARGHRLPGFLECTWKSLLPGGPDHLLCLDSEMADIQQLQEPQADDRWDVGVRRLFQRRQSEDSPWNGK